MFGTVANGAFLGYCSPLNQKPAIMDFVEISG